MKRRNIFFALAFILAIGSAFTTKPAARKLFANTPGYAKSSQCIPVVIFCDEVPAHLCTLASGEQTYKDQNLCKIPLKRSTP